MQSFSLRATVTLQFAACCCSAWVAEHACFANSRRSTHRTDLVVEQTRVLATHAIRSIYGPSELFCRAARRGQQKVRALPCSLQGRAADALGSTSTSQPSASHEPTMPHQRGSVTASLRQQTWTANVDSQVDTALHQFEASPMRSLWTDPPAVYSERTQLPSPAVDLPFLRSSSSPTRSEQQSSSNGGLGALAALRSAMQLRESQLQQPQHTGLLPAPQQTEGRTDEAEHASRDTEPDLLSIPGLPDPGPRRSAELQSPCVPSQMAPVMSGSIITSGSDRGEHGEGCGKEHSTPVTSVALTVNQQVPP